MIQISVIIPTYNRAEVLDRNLRLLSVQTLPRREYEVIVVDDGSTDETPRLLAEWQTKELLDLKVLTQKNSGQGSARNAALELATGRQVLFLGDDMLPTPGLLEAHLRFHIHNPERQAACLGRVVWHPEITVTPYMHWLTGESGFLARGAQFRFHDLVAGQQTDFWRFYTANLSLKREFLGGDRFCTDFGAGWGYEDAELGLRLTKRGLRLLYWPEALVQHYHPMTPEQLTARMHSAGQQAVRMQRLHPEVPLLPRGAKLLLQWLAARLLPFTYYRQAKRAFLAGLDAASKNS
jgi:glycosyltransferase involved in cell wall biosynthesis